MSLNFLTYYLNFSISAIRSLCFPDCSRVSSVVPVFKNIGERPTVKNYSSVSLLSVISKVFLKFLDNRIVDH